MFLAETTVQLHVLAFEYSMQILQVVAGGCGIEKTEKVDKQLGMMSFVNKHFNGKFTWVFQKNCKIVII